MNDIAGHFQDILLLVTTARPNRRTKELQNQNTYQDTMHHEIFHKPLQLSHREALWITWQFVLFWI